MCTGLNPAPRPLTRPAAQHRLGHNNPSADYVSSDSEFIDIHTLQDDDCNTQKNYPEKDQVKPFSCFGIRTKDDNQELVPD